MYGLLIPILITIYVYKGAKQTGRNAVLWSLINIAVIIGVQFLIVVAAGVLIGLGIAFFGWSKSSINNYNLPITIAAGVVSLICSYLFVVRRVNRVSDEQINIAPPQPPQFG